MAYRDNGAVGALLDEYQRAIKELVVVVSSISDDNLAKVIDADTEDKDCRSVQTILTHVIRAGYYYADAIRSQQGEEMPLRINFKATTAREYVSAIEQMFHFNEKLFGDFPDLILEEYDNSKKIKSRWGQFFDVEQMMEHAIVHILRHRRQIERFKIRM